MGLQLKKPLIAHYFKSRCSVLLSLFELVLFFKCFCFLVMWVWVYIFFNIAGPKGSVHHRRCRPSLQSKAGWVLLQVLFPKQKLYPLSVFFSGPRVVICFSDKPQLRILLLTQPVVKRSVYLSNAGNCAKELMKVPLMYYMRCITVFLYPGSYVAWDLKQVEKIVFIVFFSGDRARTKITKICEAFGANRYPFPEDLNRQWQMKSEVLNAMLFLYNSLNHRRCMTTYIFGWLVCCGVLVLPTVDLIFIFNLVILHRWKEGYKSFKLHWMLVFTTGTMCSTILGTTLSSGLSW